MVNKIFTTCIALATILIVGNANGQDTVRYTGSTLVNADYHNGQLVPVVGVHNIQTFRANREHPDLAEGFGWTYNHAPMLAYWNNRFYVEYLSDKVGESIPPGQTLLQSSADGYSWTKPDVIFPVYRIPDGTKKEGNPQIAKNLDAVMHQRMGFYVAKNKHFLALAFYAISFDAHDDPNDGKGIGRVVREVLADGKYGPIYFVHYNPGWTAKNTSYPFYTSSKNKAFVAACNELLADRLMTQGWNEEADRNDPLITLKKQYKAFNYYHLPDGRVVGLWKNALTAISKDGTSWPENASRAPGFINSNAKFWGQKISDNSYATVYNPSEYRWPLAISTSKNGLDYSNLWLINGEISPMRYGGNYKSYGPQYVRGILEGNGIPPQGKLWVTYSMNKEDIWVSSVPVPIVAKVTSAVNEVFNDLPEGKELDLWNINSPLWAPVKIVKSSKNIRNLVLSDKDPFDYAKAERIFPASAKIITSFTIVPNQNNHGLMEIELQDEKGTATVRLTFDTIGTLSAKAGARYKNFMKYTAGSSYDISIKLDAFTRFYTVTINGKEVLKSLAFAPVAEVSRIVFRTGETRRFPDVDTPADQTYDLPKAGEQTQEASYSISGLKTQTF